MSRVFARSALVALAIIVAGCATQRTAPPPDRAGYEQRRDALLGLGNWAAKGRIGVRAGRRGFSGSLGWIQADEKLDAVVRGPLGVGTVQFSGDEHRLQVRQDDGETLELTDPEREFRERYGWTIPVGSLRYWMLGVADPRSVANTVFGADGYFDRLEQREWKIEYLSYQQVGMMPMPRKLRLTSADITLTVLIKNWTLPLPAL